MKGFNLQVFLVKAMRSVVDSARVEHRDNALGMARNLHRCMWALASVWCPDGVQARAWENSFDNPSEREIDALWSYAAQHGGKGNVPLGDFLKTREAIYSRNFQRAVCRSAPTRTEGCHKKSKAIILCRTGLHKGEIETGNPQGKFIWNVRNQ